MVLAFLLLMQSAPARDTPPVLEFPTPGLDDPAAYEGYTARLYRDSRGNSVEIYIEGKTGRVVHLWADGLNESIGFTVRDSGGRGVKKQLRRSRRSRSGQGQRRWVRPAVATVGALGAGYATR